MIQYILIEHLSTNRKEVKKTKIDEKRRRRDKGKSSEKAGCKTTDLRFFWNYRRNNRIQIMFRDLDEMPQYYVIKKIYSVNIQIFFCLIHYVRKGINHGINNQCSLRLWL